MSDKNRVAHLIAELTQRNKRVEELKETISTMGHTLAEDSIRIEELEAQLEKVRKWKQDQRGLVGIKVHSEDGDRDKAVDEVIKTFCDELQAILEKDDE